MTALHDRDREGLPWFDTAYGLHDRITDLASLHAAASTRGAYWEQHSRMMHEFVIIGRFLLDAYGSVRWISENAPADGMRFLAYEEQEHFHARRVMSLDAARKYAANFVVSRIDLPQVTDVCPRCREGWTLENAHDAVRGDMRGPIVHRSCFRLAIVQARYDELREILHAAEIPTDTLFLIPSRYSTSPDWFGGPWLAVETSRGRIIFGIRKNVYSIEWPWPLDMSIFDSEEVTKGPMLIHAWSRDKAVEYLRKVWNA